MGFQLKYNIFQEFFYAFLNINISGICNDKEGYRL